jgi:hypothetical protein
VGLSHARDLVRSSKTSSLAENEVKRPDRDLAKLPQAGERSIREEWLTLSRQSISDYNRYEEQVNDEENLILHK